MQLNETRLWKHLNQARDEQRTDMLIAIDEWEEFVTALSVALKRHTQDEFPLRQTRLYATYIKFRRKFVRAEDLEAELDAAIKQP